MTGPRVPGLSDEWAQHQLELPLSPACPSCTLTMEQRGRVGHAWTCDPDRPGCPLHDVPEQTRAARAGGYCRVCGHTHRVKDRECARCTCPWRPEPVAR